MLATALVFCAITWTSWRFLRSYFVKSPLDIVAGPPASSFLSGNTNEIFDNNAWNYFADMMNKYGGVTRIQGPLGQRWLFVYDPVALHSMFLKDQASYEEPPWFIQSNAAFFGRGLLSVIGETHRKQRKMLIPVFAPKYLKDITPIFYDAAHRLVQAIGTRVEEGHDQINVLDWMSRTALELIGQAGLGLCLDPLVDDASPDPLAVAAKEFGELAFTTDMLIVRQLLPYIGKIGTPSFRRWVLDHLPIARYQKMKDILDVFHKRSSDIFYEKKAAAEKAESHNAEESGRELISVLLRANMASKVEDRVPDDEILGQISTLIVAAMDTTSNALCNALWRLSQNPDVQTKLREEIISASDGNDMSYEEIHNLPYLDAICRETLRLSPPIPFSAREAMTDAVLPLSQPMRGTDGSTITQVFVPKGTSIIGGNLANNINPNLWGSDADEWKPERWLNPLPTAIQDAPVPGIYSHLMTFSAGSRSCIGFKFSQLEMKVVLASLIANFTFEPSDIPVFWNLTGVLYPSRGPKSRKGELWLRVKRFAAAK